MKHAVYFLVFLCLANFYAYADELPQPKDFAYGIPIHTEGQEMLYQATLPFAVYQTTLRADLGDLRVFNAADQLVPHALSTIDHATTTIIAPINLPMLSLRIGVSQDLDNTKLNLYRDTNGNLIVINDSKHTDEPMRLAAYIFDTSNLQQPPNALLLDFSPATPDFSGTVRIEASDDLLRWKTLVKSAVIDHIHFANRLLEQKRIKIPVTPARYLRLSWPQEQAPLNLLSARAAFSDQTSELPRSWFRMRAKVSRTTPNDYYFDVTGHIPIDRLQFDLPNVNTLAQVEVFSRAHEKDQWRFIAKGVTYRLLSAEREVHNPEIPIKLNRDRYWLVRFTEKVGDFQRLPPKLYVGWIPQQLFFIPRGEGPYKLAYGSINIGPNGLQVETMLPGYNPKSLSQTKYARLGAPYELGGIKRLKPTPPPPWWRKWLITLVVLAGLAGIGFLAYRWYQKYRASDEDYEGHEHHEEPLTEQPVTDHAEAMMSDHDEQPTEHEIDEETKERV